MRMAHKLMMIAAVVALMVDAPMVGVEAEYMVAAVVPLKAPPIVADVMPPLMVVLLMSCYVAHQTSCAGDDQASSSFP
ncbi:unnamed protein product [Camellia sinensis]